MSVNNRAVVIIDCQPAFYLAQGTERTKHVASKLIQITPRLYEQGTPIFSVYSNAKSLDASGVPDALKDCSINLRKSHESATQGSDIVLRLKASGIKDLTLMGFHTTTCLRLSAEGFLRAGFNVNIHPELVGEGRRGRSLSDNDIAAREQQNFTCLHRTGANIIHLAV